MILFIYNVFFSKQAKYQKARTIELMMDIWYMDVSENSGTPKSSILIGFSIVNHPFWGIPIFGNTHMVYQWFAIPESAILKIHVSWR